MIYAPNTDYRVVNLNALYSSIGITALRPVTDAQRLHHEKAQKFFNSLELSPALKPYSPSQLEAIALLDQPSLGIDKNQSLNDIDTQLFWIDYRPYGSYSQETIDRWVKQQAGLEEVGNFNDRLERLDRLDYGEHKYNWSNRYPINKDACFLSDDKKTVFFYDRETGEILGEHKRQYIVTNNRSRLRVNDYFIKLQNHELTPSAAMLFESLAVCIDSSNIITLDVSDIAGAAGLVGKTIYRAKDELIDKNLIRIDKANKTTLFHPAYAYSGGRMEQDRAALEWITFNDDNNIQAMNERLTYRGKISMTEYYDNHPNHQN